MTGSGWRDPSKALPAEGATVLVWWGSDDYAVAVWTGSLWRDPYTEYEYVDPDAWHPLPEPPMVVRNGA